MSKIDKIDWRSELLEGARRLTPNYAVNQIFTSDEKQLSHYLQTMTKLHHGRNPKSARKLAFDLAVANKKKIPNSLTEKKKAGKFWFTEFMKRNNELSIRAAEATSLDRAKEFNRQVEKKITFCGSRINSKIGWQCFTLFTKHLSCVPNNKFLHYN